ncbi:MAG: MoaD/ThiS family protein [Nocardioides sp.]
MAVEVRIPTILRSYTGGAKSVHAEVRAGATSLAALIDSLETDHPGIKDRLVEEGSDGAELRRFVNVYINDEDVRFIGSLRAELADGDQVVVLPAVAGG